MIRKKVESSLVLNEQLESLYSKKILPIEDINKQASLRKATATFKYLCRFLVICLYLRVLIVRKITYLVNKKYTKIKSLLTDFVKYLVLHNFKTKIKLELIFLFDNQLK